MITSIDQIDLRPRPDKPYFSIDREWREEFIYFLMLDRFHDDSDRVSVNGSGRTSGIQAPNDQFYGGKIRGITRNLDYIAGLGCTAIWLSPIFENNAGAYHGYNINNYLDVDPNFGTKQDLIDLVDAAHSYKKDGKPFPIRIILDVVINHSGDNWAYLDGYQYDYINDQQFKFGFWRRDDRPIPTDLRDKNLYHRCGQITDGWDRYPDNQHGDIYSLKDYANDDDATGSKLINILIKSHCYWIREADIDGFRVDAVKHMGELACSRFCSNVREYAYSLGKRGFFLFGELAVFNDDIYDRYIGQNTSRQDDNKTVFFGLNSLLDFRLAKGIDNNAPLGEIIKGNKEPEELFNRIEAQRNRALNRGEIGRYLVTFVDNHDYNLTKGRFAANGTSDAQVIAAIGFLICSLGTPCIYYGTEQGFDGTGSDNKVREAMFDAKTNRNLLNTNCTIYQEISKIAHIMRTTEPLRFGRMYYRQISGNSKDFGLPFGTTYTLAFSRITYGREVLVAYNVSGEDRNDSVIVDASIHKKDGLMKFLYGQPGSVIVKEASNKALYVQLNLSPYQFVILE